MNRIRAILLKEFIHISRDKRTLGLVLLMPLFQLIIYGYGIDTDIKHISTVVYDEDATSLSRSLIQSFEQSLYFNKNFTTSDPREFRDLIDRGDAKAGLHIPPDFSKNLHAGRKAELQFIVDGSDSTVANVALNTSRAIIEAFAEKEDFVPEDMMPVQFKARLWYNPDLKTPFFMVPGLVGLLLQVLVPMLTAAAVVREKERGNLEQLLVTPIKPYELIIGKLLPYVMIGMAMAASILIAAHILFGVPVRGNVILLMFLTLMFLMVTLGVGLFASTVADNQHQAFQIVTFFVPPSILLSGYIFPRESMPAVIAFIGNFIPLTYYVKIIRGIMLKGLGFVELWPQIWPLGLMATVLIFISVKKFHKRLS